jgi:aspartyl-tRNA(Asn)/glutamyl-tRNA(Gln) amidotransferase subunit A
VEIADLELTAAAYTPLVRAEAAYVHRAALQSGAEGFSPLVRASLQAGAKLSAGDYLAALEARSRVREGVRAAFEHGGIDALVLPAAPAPAVTRGVTEVELESGSADLRAAQLALTAPFSLVGAPTASVPFAEADGLPLGLQVVAPWGEDARALDVAAWIEARMAENGVAG